MVDSLKIAVDARVLIPGEIGGLESALHQMLRAVLGVPRCEVGLLTSVANDGDLHARYPDTARHRVLPGARAEDVMPWLREHDVRLCPLGVLDPVRVPIPTVACVSDLQHEHFAGFFSTSAMAERIRAVRVVAEVADAIVTPSEFTRRDFLRRFDVAPSSVAVVPHACDVAFDEPVDAAAVAELRRRHSLPETYCLYPARLWGHKNHRRLTEALVVYRERFGAAPGLVLTGCRGYAGSELSVEVRRLGLASVVRHLGRVSTLDLVHLYDGAALMVFPSLFEGFGIPLLEAMKRGVPVVATTAGSVREVVGDAATYVDPSCAESIAAGIRTVLCEGGEVREKVEHGLELSQGFSLSRVATGMVKVLERVRGSEPSVRVVARPKVFVVTPSFNQGAFLRETIESVLSQDYPRIDYFVADGGSTDESRAILESYGDRVRWSSAPDGGQAAAVARAWEESDADVVAWLNSDDTYLPGAVSAAAAFLREHPEHAMVYGEGVYTNAEGDRLERYPTLRPFARSALARTCFVCQPTVFVRREVFRAIELPRPDLQFALDYDLWIRLSRHFSVGSMGRVMATSRVHEAAKSVAQKDAVYREIIEVSREHFGSVHLEWLTGFLHHRFKGMVGRLLGAAPAAVRRAVFARIVRRNEAGA